MQRLELSFKNLGRSSSGNDQSIEGTETGSVCKKGDGHAPSPDGHKGSCAGIGFKHVPNLSYCAHVASGGRGNATSSSCLPAGSVLAHAAQRISKRVETANT